MRHQTETVNRLDGVKHKCPICGKKYFYESWNNGEKVLYIVDGCHICREENIAYAIIK